jgi:hypothetical protein
MKDEKSKDKTKEKKMADFSKAVQIDLDYQVSHKNHCR